MGGPAGAASLRKAWWQWAAVELPWLGCGGHRRKEFGDTTWALHSQLKWLFYPLTHNLPSPLRPHGILTDPENLPTPLDPQAAPHSGSQRLMLFR